MMMNDDNFRTYILPFEKPVAISLSLRALRSLCWEGHWFLEEGGYFISKLGHQLTLYSNMNGIEHQVRARRAACRSMDLPKKSSTGILNDKK